MPSPATGTWADAGTAGGTAHSPWIRKFQHYSPAAGRRTAPPAVACRHSGAMSHHRLIL